MYFLNIDVTPASIDLLKKGLTTAFPDIKSSHRVEAIARGLDFTTYASMLEASKRDVTAKGILKWDEFKNYLSQHGFAVSAKPLFLIVGSIAMQQLLVHLPELTMHGFGVSPSLRGPDGNGDSQEVEDARFNRSRSQFLDERAVYQFLCALDVMMNIKPISTINKKADSMIISRLVEGTVSVLPDGTQLSTDYVAEGPVILAALYAGFGYSENGRCVAFSMSQKSIDLLFKEKDKSPRPPYIDRIADLPVSHEDIELALDTFDKMNEKDRGDMTARMIQLMRVFDKDRPFREIASVITAVECRLEALAHLMENPRVKEFFPPSKEQDALMVHQSVLRLVATEPLLPNKQRGEFNAEHFRKRLSELPKQSYPDETFATVNA